MDKAGAIIVARNESANIAEMMNLPNIAARGRLAANVRLTPIVDGAVALLALICCKCFYA